MWVCSVVATVVNSMNFIITCILNAIQLALNLVFCCLYFPCVSFASAPKTSYIKTSIRQTHSQPVYLPNLNSKSVKKKKKRPAMCVTLACSL